MCGLQLPSQYHEHSLVLLFPLRICASGWRGWALLRASRSVFWRSLDPSVWWELHIPHCPGHLCRAGMWQGCVCPRTWALQRVRWPGLGWRVQVWGGGAWAPGLPQSALSRGHMSPQWSCSGCLFRWDAGQAFHLCEHPVQVKNHEICWNSVFFYQRTQKSGSWQTAPLNVRGRYRWIFLDDGERSVPPTGVWPMPMSSVVSLAVESPSPLPEDHTLREEVIRSQQSDFTAQGLSPYCRVVLWLPWVVLTVPMATWPLWSSQVREREGLLVLRMLLEWNVPKSREGGKIGFES